MYGPERVKIIKKFDTIPWEEIFKEYAKSCDCRECSFAKFEEHKICYKIRYENEGLGFFYFMNKTEKVTLLIKVNIIESDGVWFFDHINNL